MINVLKHINFEARYKYIYIIIINKHKAFKFCDVILTYLYNFNYVWIIGPLQDPVTWYKITHASKTKTQVQVDWYELHCFGSPTAQLAHHHV